MSFGLDPLALLLSDSKQQKDLHFSQFPLNFSLCLPATEWGGKTNIKTEVNQLLLSLQKCRTWDNRTYLCQRNVSSASFFLLHLEDNESSSLYKEKIASSFKIWKYKVLIVSHSGWVRVEVKTLSQVWAYRCELSSHLHSIHQCNSVTLMELFQISWWASESRKLAHNFLDTWVQVFLEQS